MRRIIGTTLVLLLCLAATNAFAGRIFGDIKMDGKPVPEGLKVTIAMAPAPAQPNAKEPAKTAPAIVDTSVTDKFGSYKLNVKDEGKCILTLVYNNQPVTLEIFSYKAPTRYDLILELKDGKPSLRRK
jgi:hypothetical protein